ncbi:hypothetical protein TSUD_144510 [Trifolium subterraneum]|uniref:Uncharacterized protein n=1 Tax=Trifolium subterraneum TaxID=3900 RepID=A0A2Z6P4D0_TRISU|nr:hypothetical protein TSUD_144510 [Trifolium subterraneum]
MVVVTVGGSFSVFVAVFPAGVEEFWGDFVRCPVRGVLPSSSDFGRFRFWVVRGACCVSDFMFSSWWCFIFSSLCSTTEILGGGLKWTRFFVVSAVIVFGCGPTALRRFRYVER